MDVTLAGHTLDAEIIRQLKERCHDTSDNHLGITPETISAAYARISRDPAPVTELRAKAREEVAEARKSNRSIVFSMGHQSVAEHVKLNFDILGLSRLAVEVLEHHRLCSYTEKSQRYITLDGDYIVPQELTRSEAEKFHQLVKRQNDFYFAALPKLINYQRETHPKMAWQADERKAENVPNKMNQPKNTLEGWAKEDARYSLSLATETQLGFSANARNLEYAIRRFKYHELLEVRELGARLYAKAKALIPSLIILADKDEFFRTQKATLDDNFLEEGQKDMLEATRCLLQDARFNPWDRSDAVELLYADNVDERILTSLIKKKGGLTQREARAVYYAMPEERKLKYLQDCLQNLGEHDALPREFEKGSFTYQLIISSSCFAQLKRHRMATILDCRYAPDLSITVPESIKALGMDKDLLSVAKASADLYQEIKKNCPELNDGNEGPDYSVADYCLTNAHRKIIEIELNLRDLYHFSRLREDAHAQWDIRAQAEQMVKLAKKAAPLTTLLLGGKDQFAEIRKKLYEKEII